MPPKQRITREMILERSFDMFCREGMESVNARSVAKALNCSTQPIFSYYSGMSDLKETLENKAKEALEEALCMPGTHESLLVNMCVALASFAAQQPNLFGHLFAHKQDGAAFKAIDAQRVAQLQEREMQLCGFDEQKALELLEQMWIYAHGYALLLASGHVQGSVQETEQRIGRMYGFVVKALAQ